MRYALLILSIALCGVVPLGCGGAQHGLVKPGPAVPGLNLSGRWYSPEFGEMKIVHAANNVSGEYADRRGPDHNGRFRGQLIGDLVRLEWIKPGNAIAAIMPRRGRAWLRVNRQGNRLSGKWGFDASESDGGLWNAERSTSNTE